MQLNGTLGIISCYSLADEIVYLLERDGEIENIFLVSNPEGLVLYKRKIKGLVREKTHLLQQQNLRTWKRNQGFTVIIWMIPASLHENPSLLATILVEVAAQMSLCVNSIFIAHGLCGIHQHKVIRMMEEIGVPTNLLTYPDGEIADDCFGSFIGGKKQYLEFIKKHKFALFVTTGFADYLKERHEHQDIEAMVAAIEELRFTLETLGFKKIIKLESKVGNKEEFDRTVEIFSTTMGLEIESHDCELTVFDHSYDLAKRHIHPMNPNPTVKSPGGTLYSISPLHGLENSECDEGSSERFLSENVMIISELI